MALEFLSPYFLNPIGLAALLGLIPLIGFYLMKPDPEEQIMPAMTFFQQEKNSGKFEQAIQKLRKNLFLLIHIIIILGFSTALAHLYIKKTPQAENKVIILDRSASMQDDLNEAKKFIGSNLGKKNTLILVGEETKVPLEDASPSQVKNYINSVEARDVETDIAAGLELASDYQGEILIASDMDQTVTRRNIEEMIDTLRTQKRRLQKLDTETSNSWGIVNVEPGRDNSSIDIKNYRNKASKISIKVNSRKREIEIKPNEVKTLTLSTSKLTKVKLPSDGLKSDNRAFISVPSKKSFKAVLISDSGNPFFKKALELIDFIEVRSKKPPIDTKLNADVYIIGNSERVLRETVDEIETDVENGASLIVFSQPSLFSKGFDSLPVNPKKGFKNSSVEFQKPRRIKVGKTQIQKVKKIKGESLSEPENALIKSKYGEGEVVFYNIDNRDFREDFLYPIFWKEMLEDLTEKPSVTEFNLETGNILNETNVQTPAGEMRSSVYLSEIGLYNSSRGVFAANLESREESKVEELEINAVNNQKQKSPKDLQNLIVSLLALLALLELIYLAYLGDV